MKKQTKSWLIGALSALVAACSGLLPAAATSVCPGIGSFCGGCSGNCFSLPGVFWLGSLYVRHFGRVVKQKVNSILK